MPDKIFLDSNLWIYLLAESRSEEDNEKKLLVANLFERPSIFASSTQVLNEVANVVLRKYNYSETDTHSFLLRIDGFTEMTALTKDLSFKALQLKSRYMLSWFDSLIVAAALKLNCDYLYSEDMQDGLIIDDSLTIKNPFNL